MIKSSIAGKEKKMRAKFLISIIMILLNYIAEQTENKVDDRVVGIINDVIGKKDDRKNS